MTVMMMDMSPTPWHLGHVEEQAISGSRVHAFIISVKRKKVSITLCFSSYRLLFESRALFSFHMNLHFSLNIFMNFVFDCTGNAC